MLEYAIVKSFKATKTEYNSVCKAKPGDPRQVEYLVFDNWTLLPEYIIDFEYLSTMVWFCAHELT